MQEYQVKVYGDRIEWHQNGQLHRIDGPAVEYVNGNKYWYQNGKFHRVDGPAVERADGGKVWYIDGHYLAEEEFNARTKPACNGKVVGIDGVKYKLTAV